VTIPSLANEEVEVDRKQNEQGGYTMKWAILAMVMIAIALGAGFTGCSNEIGSQRQFPSEPDLDTGISDGSENPPENLVPLHSETLQLVHKYDDEVDLEDAAFRASSNMK